MYKIIIEGNNKLSGKIRISGSKNSAVALVPAAVLCDEEVTIANVPSISDIDALDEILRFLGAKVKRKDDVMKIDSSKIKNKLIPEKISKKLRASYYFMGALLSKFKKVEMYFPGGCSIGARPINLHLKGFEKLGVDIKEEYGEIYCNTEKIVGTQIHLDLPSVGATENIILASCLGEGTTVITNAAREPEIEDMIKYLNKMGAKINGAGTDKVEIIGVKRLAEVSYNIMPDRIEAGTYLVAGAITSGDIKLLNVNSFHIEPILNKLEETNCKLNINKDEIEIIAPKRVKSVDIKTMPYPGFPTDMQSIFGALLITAKGTSVITENIFESRYKYAQELIRMGAKINVEGRTAIIKGTKKIQGTNVVATDLRGGAALIMAGLYAKGITQIDNIHYILRGYEKIDEKLKKLGAKIHVEK